MMRSQTYAVNDAAALKEIQQALKHGNVAGELARYSDDSLIRLLHRLQRPQRILSYGLAAIYLAALAFIFYSYYHKNYTPIYIIFLNSLQILNRKSFKIKPPLLEVAKHRLSQASLAVSLDALSLKIPNLEEIIQERMTQCLSITTKEELEELTDKQRKQLMQFTLSRLHINLTTHPLGQPLTLTDQKAQAATFGFLALALLKQPGAKHVSAKRVPTTSRNLKRAIEEYHIAMKAAG